jgi:mannose-6-phosphate isomerase-like protein (cupin superfamily)
MRLSGRVDKSWGYEDIFITNDHYCGKYLVFDQPGNKTSMHFHKEKHETWVVIRGSFKIRWIETDVGNVQERILSFGQRWTNEPLLPHQLEAIESNSIVLEISTPDSAEDNYRIYR